MQLHYPNLGLLLVHLSKADLKTLDTFINIEKPEPPVPVPVSATARMIELSESVSSNTLRYFKN
jgi:hypothetical protein